MNPSERCMSSIAGMPNFLPNICGLAILLIKNKDVLHRWEKHFFHNYIISCHAKSLSGKSGLSFHFEASQKGAIKSMRGKVGRKFFLVSTDSCVAVCALLWLEFWPVQNFFWAVSFVGCWLLLIRPLWPCFEAWHSKSQCIKQQNKKWTG